MRKLAMTIAMAVLGAMALNAAWYENPGTAKVVPLATSSSKTLDPHFMNKSADDSLLLVNLNGSGDNAGPILADVAELADPENANPTLHRPVASPSAGYGADWKGGAISSDRSIAILGCASGNDTSAFNTDGTVWIKGANIYAATLDPAADGLDFGKGSTYLYSNVAGEGGIVRRTVGTNGALSGAVTKPTTPNKVLNVSVYTVNGRELVYYGNGEDGTSTGAIYAMDVTDADSANWTETDLATSLPGPITNVKLSNEDTDAPILYALTDNGYLGIYQLRADGLAVTNTIQVIGPTELKLLAGGSDSTTARFRNFEVTKDGTTAFLINRTDEHNVSLAVIASDPYIETLGVEAKGIDTGYTPGPDTAIWADFAFMGDNPKDQYFIYEAGVANSSGKAFFRPYINNSQSSAKGTRCYAFALNTSLWISTGVPVTTGERHQLTLDSYNNRATFVSGSDVKTWNFTTAKATTYASTPLYLFSSSGMYSNFAEMRLYGFKIYEKGELVRNYVPAKRGEVVGLYETEEGRFFSDCRGDAVYTGVGALKVVPEDANADNNYIESDGTAAINTGYYANRDTTWELDFQLSAEVTDGPVICGAYGGKSGFSTILYYDKNKNFASCMRDGDWSSTWVGKGDLQRRQFFADGQSHRWMMKTNGVYQLQGRYGDNDTFANTAVKPFSIFANGNDVFGDPTQLAKVKVFGLKIWEKGVLKRDYRPVILDGRVGFKELVEEKFVSSQGLTAGSGVPSDNSWGEPAIASIGVGMMGTGVFPTDKTRIEVDYDLDAANKVQARIYGSDALYEYQYRRTSVYINSNGIISFGYGDAVFHGEVSGAKPTSGRHQVIEDFKNRTFSFMSGAVTNWSKIISAEEIQTNFCLTTRSQITLFGSPEREGAAQPRDCLKGRIFRAKFYEDDVLIRDFVPAKRYGVAGFRDQVNGEFYTCEGLRAVGNVEELAETSNAYVEANGGTFQYVTTPHFASERARYEVDFQLTKANSGSVLFGAYDCSFSSILYMPSGSFQLGMADGSWGSASLGKIADQDLNRHTIVMDGPSRLYTFFNADGTTNAAGNVKGSRTMNNTATKPTLIFGCSNGGTSAGNGSQIPSARIYGMRVYESGKLVSDYVPRKVDGIVGFKDLVSGKFLTGENLVGGGGILDEKGDPYLATGDRKNHTINTGVTITSNSCIEADFALMVHENNPQQFLWETGTLMARMYTGGSKTNDAVYSWSCYTGSTGNYTSSGTFVQEGVRRHFILDSYHNKVMLETGGYTNYTGAITSTRNGTSKALKLFGNSGQNGNYANIRLYRFKIYEKGELIRDYVPYQVGDEGTLKDLVTGNVITRNDANYTLTLNCGGELGEENVADLVGDDAYVDLDGTAPLVLGYYAKSTTRIEADFQAQPPYKDSMFLSPWKPAAAPNTALWVNGSGLFQYIVGANKFVATTKYADGQRYVAMMDAPNDKVALKQVGGATYDATPGTTYSGTAAWPLTLGGSVMNAEGTTFDSTFTCKMRCFGVKIYESNTLVHNFVPYRNAEGVAGMLDIVGNLGFKTATSASIGGKPYTGEITVYATQPEDTSLGYKSNGTLVANVVGADHYVWTLNGVEICGSTSGTLPIVWYRHTKDEGYADTYTVIPIFVVDGEEVPGETKTARVTSTPAGLMLIIK